MILVAALAAALGPAIGRMLPSLAGGAGAGAPGGFSSFLRGLFAPSSGSALSAQEIEGMLAEGLFSSAGDIFSASPQETSDLIAGRTGGSGETEFDANSGAATDPDAEAARAAIESARLARSRRSSQGSGSSGGGGFSAVAAEGLLSGGGGGGLSEMLGGGLVAGAIGVGVSKATDTAQALAAAPFQIANAVIPEGDLKGAAASGLGALGGLGSAAMSGIKGDPAGWVQGMTQFVTGLIDAGKQLKEFASNRAEENRRHAQYNGEVAQADARLEIGRLRRDMEMANETGGTASATIRSEDRLEESLKEFNQTMATIQNLISIIVNEVVRGGVEYAKLSPILQVIGRVAEKFEGLAGPADANPWMAFQRDLHVEAMRRDAERRRRERGLE